MPRCLLTAVKLPLYRVHIPILAAVLVLTLLRSGGMCDSLAWGNGDPNETVRSAGQVLAEIMAMPGKRIPESLLGEAQGVVIVPNVIKIGFVAGARRGHGVVLVRDNDGEWSLPQFVTLTGGSVGWQAGIQGTDVVLVFTTKKSVEGLLRGKFTIGADAAAAAGPVGRNAAAATDTTLKSEILSYSRSRGLFLGVSIDGSALEIDNEAHLAFYGSQSSELPRRLPESAAQLRQELANLSSGGLPPANPLAVAAAPAAPTRLDALRRALDGNARHLYAIIDPPWQQYLALPPEVFTSGAHPSPQSLSVALGRYDLVAKSGNYKRLVERQEFQATSELLREYTGELSAAVQPTLQLPPPPAAIKK